MSDKLTKKDLQAKIESLEKELYLAKNKTQLARNYEIVKSENQELEKKLHKKKEFWMKWAKDQLKEEEEDEDEDSE
tara:strand:- start:2819 stop:3046 length:228 start_codon:yes stop_codon:yes gene_type:complete